MNCPNLVTKKTDWPISMNYESNHSESRAKSEDVSKPKLPALIMPVRCPENATVPDPDERDEDFDLNNVQVIDDLSINRWLMRVMRLGANYVSTGSNGYRSASIKSSPTANGHANGGYFSRGRRYSACESLLRPAMTSRGRRFSDCVNLPGHPSNPNSLKYQRRGAQSVNCLKLHNNKTCFAFFKESINSMLMFCN